MIHLSQKAHLFFFRQTLNTGSSQLPGTKFSTEHLKALARPSLDGISRVLVQHQLGGALGFRLQLIGKPCVEAGQNDPENRFPFYLSRKKSTNRNLKN
jgi:hypothetical protein